VKFCAGRRVRHVREKRTNERTMGRVNRQVVISGEGEGDERGGRQISESKRRPGNFPANRRSLLGRGRLGRPEKQGR